MEQIFYFSCEIYSEHYGLQLINLVTSYFHYYTHKLYLVVRYSLAQMINKGPCIPEGWAVEIQGPLASTVSANVSTSFWQKIIFILQFWESIGALNFCLFLRTNGCPELYINIYFFPVTNTRNGWICGCTGTRDGPWPDPTRPDPSLLLTRSK